MTPDQAAAAAIFATILSDGDWHALDARAGALTLRQTCHLEHDPAGGAPRLVLR